MNYLGNNYLFKKNLQGDIIEIWGTADGSSRSDFRKLVTYTYDAWGNITSMVDTTDNWYRVGTANPFRYRGYYYDNESGLYYLQSRYYDPVTGRFLNADAHEFLGATETPTGYNLYSYCDNNYINDTDPSGNISAKQVANIILDIITCLSETLLSSFFIELILDLCSWLGRAKLIIKILRVTVSIIFFMNAVYKYNHCKKSSDRIPYGVELVTTAFDIIAALLSVPAKKIGKALIKSLRTLNYAITTVFSLLNVSFSLAQIRSKLQKKWC